MSTQEFSRFEDLLGIQSDRLRIEDVCSLVGLKRRQVFRLLRGKQDRATSLLSKRRGRRSNHRVPDDVSDLRWGVVPPVQQSAFGDVGHVNTLVRQVSALAHFAQRSVVASPVGDRPVGQREERIKERGHSRGQQI
jgi:hypothetical protein